MDTKKQIIIFISLSLLVGFLSNIFNSNPIPWIAKPMDLMTESVDLESILSDPQIREIDLKMATSLHKSGLLFVDARAEEYLHEGVIPRAIASDDFGLLSEQIEYLIGFDKGFVVYCSDDDCGSSEELAFELQDMGFMNIFVFKGGWKSWTEAGMEIEKP